MIREHPAEQQAVHHAVRVLLAWAGDDPDREGLRDTPARVVRAHEEFFCGYALDPEAILESLKAGRFYSSQGPDIHDIRIEGEEVAVECSPAATVVINGRGSRADKTMGLGLTAARFSLKRFRDAYFRITVIDAHGRKAWSNAVWLT